MMGRVFFLQPSAVATAVVAAADAVVVVVVGVAVDVVVVVVAEGRGPTAAEEEASLLDCREEKLPTLMRGSRCKALLHSGQSPLVHPSSSSPKFPHMRQQPSDDSSVFLEPQIGKIKWGQRRTVL